MKRLTIRMWRVSVAEPYGLHVWFDPSCEVVRLFPLSDGEVAELAGARELAAREGRGYLDSELSVSADGPEPEPDVDLAHEQLSLLGEDTELPF